MSREFIFFPGVKTPDGKYNCLYWKKDEENLKPADVYWASGSFINGQWFLDNGHQLKPTELHKDIVDEFTWSFDEDTPLEEKQCFLYEIPLSLLATAKPERGLIEGYVPIKELEAFGLCEDIYDKQEFVAWEMSTPIPASVYAEFGPTKRAKYGKVAFVDTYSEGYVCQVLSEVMSAAEDYKLENSGAKPCVLMLYSF